MAQPPTRRIGEAAAVAELHHLHAESVRAFTDRDAVWYERQLGDDFVCTFADGRRVRTHEFLRQLHDARTRPADSPALTHATTMSESG